MEDEPIVLKEASCPSLSALSTITYQLGIDQQGTIQQATTYIRLAGNSGNGNFNGYWVPLPRILQLLSDQEEPFVWDALCPLFEGRSVNSACFLMAALLAEGLVRQSDEQPRRYELADTQTFMAEMKAMMSPKPKPKKGGSKPPPTENIPSADPDPPADLTETTA